MTRLSPPRACGFLIFCRQPAPKFLLMKHVDRWDLPKGHVEPDEEDIQTAFRELEEETGISRHEVEWDDSFLFEIKYEVAAGRYGGPPGPATVMKSVAIFLGFIESEREVELTEHPAAEWFPWNPPHQIQTRTIDPLLHAVAQHLTVGQQRKS